MNDKVKVCAEIIEAKYKEFSDSLEDIYKQYTYYRRHKVSFVDDFTKSIDFCCAILNEDEKKELNKLINSQIVPMACPIEGEFYGYKACYMMARKDFCIVKLRIPSDAKRSSGFDNKCRCDKAEVIDILNPITGKHLKKARSMHPHYDRPFYDILTGRLEFIYEVGKIVKPTEPFDNCRWNTCSTGIHFFMTEEEAMRYASEM